MIRNIHMAYLVGKRVRLLHTDDAYTTLRRGDEGVVDFIDDAGTVHVKWDNGSSLGMVLGHDWFEEVDW